MRRFLILALLMALILPAIGLCEEHERVVYLTFDDGPKQATPQLLEVLEELDVPATFFLVGYAVRAFPEYTAMIYERGYAIGCHTMDHSSWDIKHNPEYLETVFTRFTNEVRTAVGDPLFTTNLFRFPGGSTSYPYKAKKMVTDLGWAWFDWSAMTADDHSNMGKKEVLAYVRKTTSEDEDVVILLAHDGKTSTREALPDIVNFYRMRGYEFRALSLSDEDREILTRCPGNLGLPEAN